MKNSFIKFKSTFLILLVMLIGACSTQETLEDPQGNVYKTKQIGEQTWMTENLKLKIEGKSFCYDDLESNCDTMGVLYTWEGALEAANKIEGWHLPTKEEWLELIEIYGKDSAGFYNITSTELGFNPQWAGVKLPSGKSRAKGMGMVNYWSSNTADTSQVLDYSVAIMSNLKKISPHNYPKVNACSVRLIKD